MSDRWSGPWHIVDKATRKSLESHGSESRATYFCEAVNDHEVKCGREPRYVVEKRL